MKIGNVHRMFVIFVRMNMQQSGDGGGKVEVDEWKCRTTRVMFLISLFFFWSTQREVKL